VSGGVCEVADCGATGMRLRSLQICERPLIPWVHLDTARIPNGQADLLLKRRGTEFSIMSGMIELMNSRLSGSEKALATLPCAKIGGRSRARILIGGLGMGFTLRAALESLGPDARIEVAELLPAVVGWARGPMAELFGDCLSDPRVTLRVEDVAIAINAPGAGYDAIMLDVDNGPYGLNRTANDGLYSPRGLGAARKALTAGGVLAVWSADADASFTKLLGRSGYAVEEHVVRAHRPGKGARHMIWLATRD